jgi:hypothetical protein
VVQIANERPRDKNTSISTVIIVAAIALPNPEFLPETTIFDATYIGIESTTMAIITAIRSRRINIGSYIKIPY